MSTSSLSSISSTTRHSRLLAHTFLLISTNSLTLCLLYTLKISPSKQHFGFRTKLAVLQISWLVASGLVLVVSLCYLISSYYRGHQRRMVAAAARHDIEVGMRGIGGEGGGGEGGGGGGGNGRRGATRLIAGPPYELQRRPGSIFSRALALARGQGNAPNPTLVLEGGGMDVVREKERRRGPIYAHQKPLPPDPPTEDEDGDGDEEQLWRPEPWQRAPEAAAAAPPAVNNLSRALRNPLTGPGTAIYPGRNTGASAILPFGQVNVNSMGGAPGVRVGAQGGAVHDDNDNESVLSSQPLYENSELRDVIGRYL